MNEPWKHRWCDYYETLQVSISAEPEVILAAYKRLAAKYHPDVAGASATERMKRINEAKEVLSDKSCRANYDRDFERLRKDKLRGHSEDLGQARAGERRAREEADKARREAIEAKEQAARARKELDDALKRVREQNVKPVAPAPAPAPQGFLDVLKEIGKAAVQSAYEQQARMARDLTGVWVGSDGLSYGVNQQGQQVYLQACDFFGRPLMQGAGVLNGTQLQIRYQLADGSTGRATGNVSPDGRQIFASAHNDFTGMSAPILLQRT